MAHSMLSDVRKALPLTIALYFLILGCDRTPPPPPPPAAPPPATQPAAAANDVSAPPTTQQLFVIPITLQLPAGWSMNPDGGVDLLQGPLPHPEGDSTATLEVGHMQTIQQQDYQSFLRGAHIQMEDDPAHVIMSGPKTIGKLTILDDRVFPQSAASLPSGYSPLFKWTIWIFVPSPSGNEVRYNLTFVGLDLRTYLANKDFLQRMIQSIRYDPSADGPMRGLGG